jgi:ABC-2 type transport system ATP-binding protein
LSKTFGSIQAVRDLSFSVQRGSVTGFLGPNGSGKSTTLRMMLGLVRPTTGDALVNGVPYTSLQHPSRVVGAVLDAQSVHPKRTARHHLRLFTPVLGLPDQRADDVLALVGLTDAADRPAGQFSLGMRQRLALATALLGDPEILVLDEPANGLDPEGIAWLRDFLRSYARSGRTVLVSSHIIREVEQIVDHLVILSYGSLVYQGSIDQLRQMRPGHVLVASSDPPALAVALAARGVTDTRIGPDGRLVVTGSSEPDINAIASEAGVTVFGTSAEHIDLEQVFLSMTAGQYVAAPVGPNQPQNYPPQNYAPPNQQWGQPQQWGPPPPYQQGPWNGGRP